MQVYSTREFSKFARKKKLSDDELCKAIGRLRRGLVYADLDGQGRLVKQPVARKGSGASKGFRVIIIRPIPDVVICVHGYAKSEKDNVNQANLELCLDLLNDYDGKHQNFFSLCVFMEN